MTKYLFLFTITPVQSFVEQARKTQDLYASSFLLSYLCKTAIDNLPEGAELIFPDKMNQSLPNRFLAIIETEKDNIKNICQSIESIVKERIEEIANKIMDGLKITKPVGFNEQIKNYFTINWVALPWDETNYRKQYKEIESIMGATKSVRVFHQFSDQETGRKCSICGERNVKFYRMTKHEKDEKAIKNKKLFSNNVLVIGSKEYSHIPIKYLKSGEGLCGVCFMKRCLEVAKINSYNAEFPSTAEVALFEAFQKLPYDIKPIIESGEYEPQGIFLLKNKQSLDNLTDISEKEKTNTKEIYNALVKNEINFSPYYAVVLFDGDNMGKWLSGENIKDQELKNFHTRLTKQLSEFAKFVRGYGKPPRGITVYAGGEDFLGFFNLCYLLEAIKELRQKFHILVNEPLREFYKDSSKDITFSAGIVIAHIKTPLSEVLRWAREVEHKAKKIDSNKDAFAIAVLKHSGEIEYADYKWKITGEYVIDRLSLLINAIKDDKLSNTFIKKLHEEMLRLMDKNGKFYEDTIVTTELNRLIKRSFIRQNIKEDEINELMKSISLPVVYTSSRYLGNFLSLLNICDFISRQLKGV